MTPLGPAGVLNEGNVLTAAGADVGAVTTEIRLTPDDVLVPRSPLLFLFLKSRRASKGPESMTLGQRVIGRNADGWYYHCTIIGMATQIFYEVNFDDGSYCDNLHPENVLVSV